MLEQFNAIFYEALPAILSVVLPVAALGIGLLVRKYTSKLDTDTQVQLDGIVSELVEQGVLYAEQWAKNKRRAEKEKPDGQEKLREATAFVVAELEGRGITGLARASLERQIEAAVGAQNKKVGG